MNHLISELWAWVVTDADGNEGVLRRLTPIGTQPMIAHSRDRLDQFKDDAVAVANEMGMPLKAARFERADRIG